MKSRVEACMSGPRSILDAEHELKRLQIDEQLSGLHVLVTDDEPRIREEIRILSQVGCRVTLCENGREAIDSLEHLVRARRTSIWSSPTSSCQTSTATRCFRGTRLLSGGPRDLMTGFGDPSHSIVRASQKAYRRCCSSRSDRTTARGDQEALQLTVSDDEHRLHKTLITELVLFDFDATESVSRSSR